MRNQWKKLKLLCRNKFDKTWQLTLLKCQPTINVTSYGQNGQALKRFFICEGGNRSNNRFIDLTIKTVLATAP